MTEEAVKSKIFCGEECDYCRRLERGMQEMLEMMKKMEKSVGVAKSVIIGLTDENIRLKEEIRRQVTRRG
jgi:hypothetical protein